MLKQMASFFVNFPLNLCRIVDIFCVNNRDRLLEWLQLNNFDVWLCGLQHTSSDPYCFVEFVDHKDAASARATMNKRKILGKVRTFGPYNLVWRNCFQDSSEPGS